MSRYIDVSNLDIPSDENDYDELVAFADKVAEMITDAPSIDIVRCRECEHGTWHEQTEMYICSANDQDLYEAEHFCSYGERREP